MGENSCFLGGKMHGSTMSNNNVVNAEMSFFWETFSLLAAFCDMH